MYSYEDAMKFIGRFSKKGSPVKDLSRIKRLMNMLKNPQDQLKFIHIAGTNGKGSTVQFCSSALIEAGYKVGQFTSPFIIDYTDRIRINNINISGENVAKYAEIIEKVTEDCMTYSQFEITNAIAFMYFKEENCDIVCLETGVGGLLDSTNIVKNTLISIITSISFDHTMILGDTIKEIALHKAGIIKQKSNVILSLDNPAEVIDIVSSCTERKNSMLIMPDKRQLIIEKSDIYGSCFIYKGEEYSIKMAGNHQVNNAVSAIEALKLLNKAGFDIPEFSIKCGLLKAVVSVRAEIVSFKPLILIDGAHNPSGIQSLCDLIRSFILQKPVIIVVGMLFEKDFKQSANELSAVADKIVCLDCFNSSAVDAEGLAEVFVKNGKYVVIEKDIQSAIEEAKVLAGSEGIVIICGSLYLASEARNFILPADRHNS